MDINEILAGYVAAMLWSSHNDKTDENFYADELAPESMEIAINDCKKFVELAGDLLPRYVELMAPDYETPVGCIGHDFWLTRAGHGVGFWDRGLDELGDELTAIVQANFKNIDPYMGDDGKVYTS